METLQKTPQIDFIFLAGFTGYVPKSRFLIGRSYTATTNEALIQFGRESRGEFSSTLPPVASVCGSTRGPVPFYTGHVPGRCKPTRNTHFTATPARCRSMKGPYSDTRCEPDSPLQSVHIVVVMK